MDDAEFYVWWLDLAELVDVKKRILAGLMEFPNILYDSLMSHSDTWWALDEGRELLGKVAIDQLPEYIRDAISPVIDDEWITPDPRFSNCYGFFVALSQRVNFDHLFKEHGKLQRFDMPPPDTDEKDLPVDNNEFRVWWLLPDELRKIHQAIASKRLSLSWELNTAIRMHAEREDESCCFGQIDLADSPQGTHKLIARADAKASDEYRHQDRIGFYVNEVTYLQSPWVFEGIGRLEMTQLKRAPVKQPLTPYTVEECQALFLEKVREATVYWRDLYRKGEVLGESAISGVAHSILSTIGGCSIDIPGFLLVPFPHPDDHDYVVSMGERPWPSVDPAIADKLVDIGESIQSHLYQKHSPIVKSYQQITLKEWRNAQVAERWRYVTHVLILTQEVRDLGQVSGDSMGVFMDVYNFAFRKAIELGMYVVPYEYLLSVQPKSNFLYVAFDEEDQYRLLTDAILSYVVKKIEMTK